MIFCFSHSSRGCTHGETDPSSPAGPLPPEVDISWNVPWNAALPVTFWHSAWCLVGTDVLRVMGRDAEHRTGVEQEEK